MKRILIGCLLVLPLLLPAKEHAVLLPVPQCISWGDSFLVLDTVSLDTGYCRSDYIAWLESTGTVVSSCGKKITVSVVDTLPEVALHPEEGYLLQVHPDGVDIQVTAEKGAYWALQTLRQLTRPGDDGLSCMETCRIVDWPAFSIRGFMHDVGRSYIPVDELKREIRQLSRYKINVFHWHLTENQAWRLESCRFPQLNDSLVFERYPGRYYTRKEAAGLVDFCRAHQVLLIPEIDMPGHSAVFRRAFHCDMQSAEGVVILKQLMDEVCEIFKDVPYIHIGTDEVQFSNPDFVPEMVAYIRNKGKKVVSWNPGWRYAPGEIDLLQMWSSRGEPHPGIPVIDSRLHYLNHYDAFADVAALYNSNIAGQQQGSADFAGTILAVWNDRRIDRVEESLIQNAFYPSMLAMSERAWRGGGEGYFYELGTSLGAKESDRFRQFADFEKRMLWHKENCFEGFPFAYVRQTDVNWRISDPFPNEGDLERIFPPEHSLKKRYTYRGKPYGTRNVTGAGIYLRHVWGQTVPAVYDDAQPFGTAYAWTWIWSPCRQEVGLWANTQNYSRSEKDLPPPAGKWDYRESRFWLNGEVIAPPVWTCAHTVAGNETLLGNENFEVREPIRVILKKGWNKVLIKLPVAKFSTAETRLVKWMFTFVLVTPDGSRAIDNVIYSPDKKRR